MVFPWFSYGFDISHDISHEMSGDMSHDISQSWLQLWLMIFPVIFWRWKKSPNHSQPVFWENKNTIVFWDIQFWVILDTEPAFLPWISEMNASILLEFLVDPSDIIRPSDINSHLFIRLKPSDLLDFSIHIIYPIILLVLVDYILTISYTKMMIKLGLRIPKLPKIAGLWKNDHQLGDRSSLHPLLYFKGDFILIQPKTEGLAADGKREKVRSCAAMIDDRTTEIWRRIQWGIYLSVYLSISLYIYLYLHLYIIYLYL